MTSRHPRLLVATLVAGLMLGTGTAPSAQAPGRLQLVIVVDGLRPDQITERGMPRLYGLAARGVQFTAHHSVFPTVTRVNAATFVTGVLPARHGLLGNAIYIPSVDPVTPIDTADHEALLKVAAAEGQLLTAPTIGQMLERAGKRFLVVSSGSPGSALLLSPTSDAGVILHTAFTRPESWQAKAVAMLGPTPAAALPNAARNRYATDLLLRIGLPEVKPDVAFVWFSDPDTTAHARGLDAPATRASLAAVDAEIGRIEDGLRASGRLATTNLIVTSDHGFSTHTGGFDLPAIVRPSVRSMPDGTPDIVTAGGAIHMRGTVDEARLTALVQTLQAHPAVGAIFTATVGGGKQGRVQGTLPFGLVGWEHPRAAQILVSANWSNEVAAGMRGTTTASGVAGHGSTSPYDVHNTLVAAGPDFREREVSDLATGNQDITPTLLRLVAIETPSAQFDGRVLEEGLRGSQRTPAPGPDGGVVTGLPSARQWRADWREVDGVRYFDSASVSRPFAAPRPQ